MNVKVAAVTATTDFLEKEISKINGKLWSNKHTINKLAVEQQMLKKQRLVLTNLRYDLNPSMASKRTKKF